MVTPVGDPDVALHTTPAGCPVSVARTCPDVSFSLRWLPPGWPDVGSPGFSHPLTGSVGLAFVNQSSPAGPALEEFLLPQAANINLTQPEAGFMFTGDLAGGLFPAVPLTPVQPPVVTSRHSGESDVVGGGGCYSCYRTTRGVL